MLSVLLLALGVLCALFIPVTGLIMCGVVLALQLAIMVTRVAVARSAVPDPVPGDDRSVPIFSVHVAIHNEPPLMVAGTLRALARQDWRADGYEVIVIDNNTVDPGLWRPVQDVCAHLGPRFRFLHRMGVPGAKAGALNIALAETRADATHIVTVDADYVVEPRFLSIAAAALHRTGAHYVQFPQAYAGCDGIASGIDAELEEYFRTNAQMADGSEAVLLTGTLCVISKAALLDAGGWSGKTVTEDAEMGVRLCRKGYSGRFIDRVVGRGYLPFSLRDLERQRHRWASGNLQTLILHAPAILMGRDRMDWRRRGAILSQLTAWLNLSIIPATLLLSMLLTRQDPQSVTVLAACSVLLTAADIVGRLIWRGLRDGLRFDVLAAAICSRLALAPVSALATLEASMGRSMHFAVTDKAGALRGNKFPVASLALFVLAAMALPAAVQNGALATAATLVLMAPFPAALAAARTLDRYRAILTTAATGTPA